MQEDNAAKRWDDSLISLGLGALVVVISGILLYNYFTGQTPALLKSTQQNVSSTTPYASAISQKSSAPVQSNAPAVTSTANVTKASLPAKHTVVAGDSYWKLAEKYYGTGYEWRRISEANKNVASAGLKAGMQLEIPKAELVSSTATVSSPAPTQLAMTQPTATPKSSATAAPSTTSTAKSSVTPSSRPTTAPTSIAQNNSPQVSAPATTTGSKTYTVVKGDSVWNIAAAQCNNPYLWTSIAKQNKLVNPSIIHAGNTFTFTCSQ